MRISDWSSDVCSSDLMATALKFDGTFTLQAKGNGPVSLLVADCRTPGHLRGYASFDAEQLDGLQLGPGGTAGIVPLLLGKGHLAFTIDPAGDDMERYQGIVDLSGSTLAEAAHTYFSQSKQLRSEEHTSELQSLMRISYAVVRL